jgi:uncharacterized membrane-anchored protein
MWRRRAAEELPIDGVRGRMRCGRETSRLLPRLEAGDIVVLDHLDLDSATACALVDRGVAAVVNASPSTSGRYPNLGPSVLVEAGVLLLDDVGTDVFLDLRDGAQARVTGNALWVGDRRVASGTTLDPLKVQTAKDLAGAGLAAQLADLVSNTTGFLLDERDLLLEGAGIPWPTADLDGKDVVVVTGGAGAADELKALKRYLRRRKPVLIGVDTGADLLLDRGLTPDLVLGDVSPRALAKAREVVLRHSVPAAVAERGIPASTFTTTAATEDFALLLADQAGARSLVLVGYPGTTEQLLDRGRAGAPSALLVRMNLLDRVVGARVAAALTPRRSLAVPGLLGLIAALGGQIAYDHWAW